MTDGQQSHYDIFLLLDPVALQYFIGFSSVKPYTYLMISAKSFYIFVW